MNDAYPRICALYSHGPHFLRMLRALRDKYPEGRVDAVMPPGYPMTTDIRQSVDDITRTERDRYSLRDLTACLRLVRLLRRRRYDVFAVMFASNRLRILARLSGARKCVHGTMDGRLEPCRASIVAVACEAVVRNVWGRLVYAYVRLAVHLLPVGDKAEGTAGDGK